MILALISQKGGVGKSTIARAVAVEAARTGRSVKIADLDAAQGTASKWCALREAAGIVPPVPVQKFQDAGRALREAADFDLLVLDGPAQADRSALAAAARADLVILPVGYSLDDLDPQARAAIDLERAGVDPSRIRLAFCRAKGSPAEDRAARDYVTRAGLLALEAAVPELPSIRQAHAAGRAATETGHASVDAKARAVAREVLALLGMDKEG